MEENNRPAPPVDDSPVGLKIRDLKSHIELQLKQIAWLEAHREKLKDLPVVSFCGTLADFDRLEHKDVVRVIRAFGGKWDKDPNADNTINYIRKQEVDNGFSVRCWSGKPPPSCRVVEVEEHVPEKVIPAHTIKVKKMVCHPDVAAVITMAGERHDKAIAAGMEESVAAPTSGEVIPEPTVPASLQADATVEF